jgi:hypothetical protein
MIAWVARCLVWSAACDDATFKHSGLTLRDAMRRLSILVCFVLAACTQSSATRVDDRTFAIHGPGVPGGSDAPNRRLAERLCPSGYRVLDKADRRNSPDGWFDDVGAVYTNWTIRCL